MKIALVYPVRPFNNLKYKETRTRFELLNSQKILGVSKEGISEKFSLSCPHSIYGITKLTSELILQEYID